MHNNQDKSILKGGVKYTTVSTIVFAISQIVTMAILARLLTKGDFGLIAIALTVKGFADLFTDFGFSTGVLHFQNISQKVYSSLYWTEISLSIVSFIIISLIAPFIAEFYHLEQLNILIPLLALGVPLGSIGSQQKIVLQKCFKFKLIATVEICAALAYLISAVLLAYLGKGVYALVFSNLLRCFVLGISFFFLGRRFYKIAFTFQFKEVIPYLKIGVYKVVSQSVNYFSSSFDVLIIGKMMSVEVLGVYNLAKDLVLKPAAIINPIIGRVFTPYFSILQDKKDELINSFSFIQKHVSNFIGLVYFAIAALSLPLVTLYYGQGNEEVAYMVSILSLFYFVRSYDIPLSMVCVAKGRTDIDMYWNFISFFIIIIFIYIGANISIYAVGVFLMIQSILLTPLNWKLYVNPLLNVNYWFYYTHLIKSIIIFLVPSIITFLVVSYFVDNSHSFILFIIGGFLIAFIDFLSFIIFDKNYIYLIFNSIKKL